MVAESKGKEEGIHLCEGKGDLALFGIPAHRPLFLFYCRSFCILSQVFGATRKKSGAISLMPHPGNLPTLSLSEWSEEGK